MLFTVRLLSLVLLVAFPVGDVLGFLLLPVPFDEGGRFFGEAFPVTDRGPGFRGEMLGSCEVSLLASTSPSDPSRSIVTEAALSSAPFSLPKATIKSMAETSAASLVSHTNEMLTYALLHRPGPARRERRRLG